mgnify:CR=1 FL=1
MLVGLAVRIGLSGLLTSSYDAMRDTITVIREASNAEILKLPIIIGGNAVNEQVSQYVGADYWITNAMDGVRLCQRLLSDDLIESSRLQTPDF